MKRLVICLATLVALSAATTAVAQSERKGKLEPAEWVPSDALFYVGITDIDATWKKFQQTASYKLMKDTVLAEAIPAQGMLADGAEKVTERIGEMLDIPASQLKNPFAGRFALYITAPLGATAEDIEPCLVAGVGNIELMKRYHEKALERLKEAGKLETETFGSETINVFTADEDEDKDGDADAAEGESDESDDMPFDPSGGMNAERMEKALDELFSGDNLPPTLALCLTADRLIVAKSLSEVKAVLRRDERGKTLADTEDHKMLLRSLRPVGTVRTLINIQRIIEIVKTTTSPDEADDVRKWLRFLGSDSLRGVVGHWRVGASSYDSKFELLALMEPQRSGLAQVLSMTNSETIPPATVSANSSLLIRANLSVPKILDQVERMIRQEDPAKADEFRGGFEVCQMPNGETANLYRELTDYLVGPLVLSLGISKPIGPDSVRAEVAMGHSDQSAMVRFFSRYLVGMLQPRELRGTQVFDIAFPMPTGMSLVPTADRLVIGNEAVIQGAIESSAANPLSESELWQRAARYVPEESWLLIYSDQRRLYEAAFDLKEHQVDFMGDSMDMSKMMLMQIMAALTQGVDEADIEQARGLLKYLAPTIMTATTTDEGVRLAIVTLKPEE